MLYKMLLTNVYLTHEIENTDISHITLSDDHSCNNPGTHELCLQAFYIIDNICTTPINSQQRFNTLKSIAVVLRLQGADWGLWDRLRAMCTL